MFCSTYSLSYVKIAGKIGPGRDKSAARGAAEQADPGAARLV
jgi:hypothetical protein